MFTESMLEKRKRESLFLYPNRKTVLRNEENFIAKRNTGIILPKSYFFCPKRDNTKSQLLKIPTSINCIRYKIPFFHFQAVPKYLQLFIIQRLTGELLQASN